MKVSVRSCDFDYEMNTNTEVHTPIHPHTTDPYIHPPLHPSTHVRMYLYAYIPIQLFPCCPYAHTHTQRIYVYTLTHMRRSTCVCVHAFSLSAGEIAEETYVKARYHHSRRIVILRPWDCTEPLLQRGYARGSATMHSRRTVCLHAHTNTS